MRSLIWGPPPCTTTGRMPTARTARVVSPEVIVGRGGVRPTFFAVGAALSWALVATFIKTATETLTGVGIGGTLSRWPVYARHAVDGEAHVPAVQGLAGLDLAAVATSSRETADEAAHAFGVDKAYGNGAALIADPDIDIVTVATRVLDTVCRNLARQQDQDG